jgi:P-type E1-E2 ATPase
MVGDKLDLWLVSADTQGTLASLAASLKVQARLLQPGDQATQKAALVEELGARQVVVIGNGANDAAMLRRAALGIAVVGNEGLASACLSVADVIAPDIGTALDLLLWPRRLIATLRT